MKKLNSTRLRPPEQRACARADLNVPRDAQGGSRTLQTMLGYMLLCLLASALDKASGVATAAASCAILVAGKGADLRRRSVKAPYFFLRLEARRADLAFFRASCCNSLGCPGAF